VTRRQLLVHGVLFLACCVTTTLAVDTTFSATLMGILLCHELGHYIAARVRGVEASLPYFIPLPPIGTIGTMGAVIRMRKPIEDRGALFDVGAAGPVAGLAVAIPLLVIGLMHSPVCPSGGILHSAVCPPEADNMQEGNSILYALLKHAVFGRWLPGDGVDVRMNSMTEAAWYGVLVTMINLMPIGQLDGGHVARAALGEAHERWSRRLHVALPVIALLVAGVMFVQALEEGYGPWRAVGYAKYGAIPWLIWAVLLVWMRRSAGEYHPPVGDKPLGPVRRVLAFGMLILFLSILTPVPMRDQL
jgi:membrane-associated protease RseP (regulator of RpoE activity)